MYKSKRDEGGIAEDVKIAITLAIKKFAENEEKEYEFPSSLTSHERKFVHNYSATLGFKTKSRGKGFHRFLTIYKKDGSTIVHHDATYKLARSSQSHILSLLQKFAVSEKERKDLSPLTEQDRLAIYGGCGDLREMNCTTGKLSNVIPQVPPAPASNSGSNQFIQFRQTLPIWDYRNEIMHAIANNSVTLISGETGCGKTTQIPQFILEYSNYMKTACRIICAEPRRIAALSMAERVSNERNESIGQTVGYQIRLESKVSPRTLLTFCTNGVLLRTLMGGDKALNSVTHVIIDEIHERDRFSDFLLLIMRDMLSKYSNLKLILMSATFDIERFKRYFGDCPVIQVPGSCYDVKHYYLEEILLNTGYMTPGMRSYKKMLESKSVKQNSLMKWCEEAKITGGGDVADHGLDQSDSSELRMDKQVYMAEKELCSNANIENVNIEREELDDDIKEKMDLLLRQAWAEGSEDAFQALIDLIMKENISVDYQHRETGVTALIAAACHAKINVIETLLHYGANITITTPNDWDALSWAKYFRKFETAELLEAYWKCNNGGDKRDTQEDHSDSSLGIELTDQEKDILDVYHHSFNDEEVDIDLIATLLYQICVNTDYESPKGSILIFLPGYDEIVRLRELIIQDNRRFDSNYYVLFTLHSQMQSTDQKRVFKPVSQDVRKIILSTNIAETSITIDDIVYVIDSGKVKEKSYDALLGISSLKSVWISQSNVIQRRGRAGRCRPGISYHLFSKTRFYNLQKHQIPEIIRMPIHELCLQTKLLAPQNVSIAEFLSKAPDPPSINGVKNSIQLLKTIDALDPMEHLTELGLHLLDLPIEPNFGKMILYSVVLKCLDPVLTIVCSLAYRDPFTIPVNQPAKKRTAAAVKKKLSAGTFSDHIILLRGFQAWQKARSDGYEKSFCEQNFISSATMEMIVGMRAQLLGQLRASGFVRARGAGDIRDLNTNSENWAVVKASLSAGAYPNSIRIDFDRQQLVTSKELKVRFHPSSVLNCDPKNPREHIYKNRARFLSNFPSDWLIYEEMTRIGRISYARCCTLVSPITIALFAGPMRLPSSALCESLEGDHDSDSESEEKNERMKSMLRLDDWIAFRVDTQTARMAYDLRLKWHSLFLRRMKSPSKPLTTSDEAVIKAIVEVLSIEEQQLGLHQPAGIGQRPRPISTDFCPPFSTNARTNASPGNKNMMYHSGHGQHRSSPRQYNQIQSQSHQQQQRYSSPKYGKINNTYRDQ